MAVNYSPVYQPVSAPVVKDGRIMVKSHLETPAETSPVKEEMKPSSTKSRRANSNNAKKQKNQCSSTNRITAPEVVTPAPKKREWSATPDKSEEPNRIILNHKTEAPITPENKRNQLGATEDRNQK